MTRQRVHIFFPNHHLAYSPTTINLYKALEPHFEVCITAPYPAKFNNKELQGFHVDYFNDRPPKLFQKVLGLLLFVFFRLAGWKERGQWVYSYARLKDLIKYNWVFKKAVREFPDEIVIAVDLIFLKLATRHFKKVHFVSLELADELIPMLRRIPDHKIESVIIQSEDRFRYLFQQRNLRYFLVQNAPVFDPKDFSENFVSDRILFNGTASPFFGVFDFIRFLEESKGEFKGCIKGNVLKEVADEIQQKHQDLLKHGILEMDDSYTSSDELIAYISRFRIGICIYKMDMIHENRFNYQTAPSGKLFNYLAAGVPVIGSNLPGLKMLEDFHCGILIDDYEPQTIRDAIRRLEADYPTYRRNCEKAARHFSFDKMVEPFVMFLTKKN